MIIQFLVIVVCLIWAGYHKAQADLLITSPYYEIVGWKKKWKVVYTQIDPVTNLVVHDFPLIASKTTKKQWWYFGLHKPMYVERFPYSSTVLVFLSDKWHWHNFLQYRYYYISMVLFIPIELWIKILLVAIVFPIIQGISFQINFKR